MSALEDPELELMALGTLIASEGRRDYLLARLHPADFTTPRAQQVFAAMTGVLERKQPITVDTVLAAMREHDPKTEMPAVAELALRAELSSSAEPLVDRVADLAVRRRLAAVSPHRIASGASTGPEALAEVRAAITAIEQRSTSATVETALDLAQGVFKHLDTVKQTPLLGISTGYHELDHMLGGLRPDGLYLLAGRPSSGKTALAMNIAAAVALRHTRGVGVFSCEMGRRELGLRLVAAEARVQHKRVEQGDLEPEHMERVMRTLGRLGESLLWVDDRGGISISELTAQALSQHSRQALSLVIVDYLQLVRGAERRRDSREQEVSEVARGLKVLAKTLHAPVLALAQLNRECEKRSNPVPRMSDLRESGELEQAADGVMFLHRPCMFDDNADPHRADVLVEKNRHGEVGTVHLRANLQFVRFDNAA